MSKTIYSFAVSISSNKILRIHIIMLTKTVSSITHLHCIFRQGFIVCYLLISLSATAQHTAFTSDDHTFYGGINVGANLSEIIGDDYHGYHKLGVNLGGVVFAHLSDRLAASMEINYSQKGSRGGRDIYSPNAGSMFEKYYLDLNYVAVPIQLHYFVIRQMSIGVGVSYAQLLKAKEDVITDPPYNIDQNNLHFSQKDYTYMFGVDYHLYNNLFFSFRYERSIVAIRDVKYVPVYYGAGTNQVNASFIFKVIYLVPF